MDLHRDHNETHDPALASESASQRGRAARTAHARQQRYRQMFEKNRAVKLLIDPGTGAIIDANPAAARFYGYELKRLRQMNITDINTLPPEEVRRSMARVMAGDPGQLIFRHRKASG